MDIERFELPPGLANLDAATRERIEVLVSAADERQGEQLESATVAALRQVPSFFRPLLRKVLGL